MNKISKKIVALATMAAFVLTLVPAAAFGANEGTGHGDISYKASGITSATTEVKAGEQIEASLLVQDATGHGTDKALANGYSQAVKLWAVDKDNTDELTDAVDFTTDNAGVIEQTGGNSNVYKFVGDNTAVNNAEFYLTFNRPGTYIIYVGVGDLDTNTDVVEDAFAANFEQLGKTLTVTVGEADVTASSIAFVNDLGGDMGTADADNPQVTLDLTDPAIAGNGFEFNGTDSYTITGTAYDKDGKVAAYETFNVSSSKDAILNILSGKTVTTKNDGTFSITFTMADTQNGYIYISNDDVDYAVRVIGQDTVATTINTVKEDGYVMAGTDSKWAPNSAENRIFSDAVQFEIKDAKGNVLTGQDAIAGESAAGWNSNDTYMNVTEKPKKSTLSNEDLQLAWENGVYTLKYTDANADAATDLIPGKYTVRVALDSKSYAVASFNVAEYGKTQDMVVELEATHNGTTVAIDDEVMLGDTITATAKYVDENGLKIPATNVQFGFDGKAVANENAGVCTLLPATVEHESLIGSLVKVKAFDANAKQLYEKDLTVVDAYNTYGLDFAPTNGEVNIDNKVTVSVVDEDGDVAKTVNGNLYAYVADQSNEAAKVSLDYTSANNVSNGKGSLTIYADKETTVDVVVAVKSGDALYAGTLEYTVGAEDLLADRSVVMTIGSTEYVVNNNLITGDAAPYVSADYRTMVPIRALAESFDAEVEFDNDARTVTIVDGDNTIVMTIDKDTYTVNDKEQTMDTAPVIGSGDRTYVPVRFVAEALGYTVTPLYDGNGLTASVVFQR